MIDLIQQNLDRLGCPYSSSQLSDCNIYLGELERWNKYMNLVGEGEGDSLVFHLSDSLLALPYLAVPGGSRAVDAGSGGGFPGIPLAIFMSDLDMTLIERSGKKAGFLRNVVALLSCGDRIKVLQEDIRSVKSGYDLVVCRALTAIKGGIDMLWPLTNHGGRLVFYKGKADRIQEELSETITPVEPEIVSLLLPEEAIERHLVIFKKISS